MLKQIACVALALAGPSLAEAQGAPDGKAPASLPIRFDCDAPGGHYSDLTLPVGSVSFTVTGKIQVISLAESDRYSPGARVMISGPNQGEKRIYVPSVGLSFLVASGANGAKSNLLALSNSERQGEPMQENAFAALPETGARFTITYDGQKVRIDAAGQHVEQSFVTAMPVLDFSCSTGDFWFTDIAIKTAG